MVCVLLCGDKMIEMHCGNNELRGKRHTQRQYCMLTDTQQVKKHMVFLRLHHVKSLTFHFASSIFPFLTLAVLEFKNKKMQNKKNQTNEQKKTNLNFAPLHLWNNSCVNKSSGQSNECVTRAVSVRRPCKLEPLYYLELRLSSLSEEFWKILTKFYRLRTIQTTELKGNELEHIVTITLFHCVCLFLI